mgnify:CR=1 FL=1
MYTTKLLSDCSIRKNLMWDNPILHSAIAFKKSEYFFTSGYSDDKIAQDYHLIIELLNRGKLAYTSKITVNYFVSENSISRVHLRSAIKGRFVGQKKTINYFWKRYPLHALRILPLLVLRILIGR